MPANIPRNRRHDDYPWVPSASDRLARVEERVSNLIDRFDAFTRSMRFTLSIGVAAGGAIGAIIASLIR